MREEPSGSCLVKASRKRIIDRFGAYLSHLISMTEDVKSAYKQKMKGYTLYFCCAFFYDILQPSAILCKVLQVCSGVSKGGVRACAKMLHCSVHASIVTGRGLDKMFSRMASNSGDVNRNVTVYVQKS